VQLLTIGFSSYSPDFILFKKQNLIVVSKEEVFFIAAMLLPRFLMAPSSFLVQPRTFVLFFLAELFLLVSVITGGSAILL